jgi:hypothetical protein
MSDLEKDKAFKAPPTANALSQSFDEFNGDFDLGDDFKTPQELFQACQLNHPLALERLKRIPPDALRDMVETMSPEVQQSMERFVKKQDGPQPEEKKPASKPGVDAPQPE